MIYPTSQERFWAGSFGDEYSKRNVGAQAVASKSAMLSRILSRTTEVRSVVEFGANIGLNMLALKVLLPNASLRAIEINGQAFENLERIEGVVATHSSILDFDETDVADLAFTSGVLIHIEPEAVPRVYEALHNASRRYVLICEYYNPSPVEVTYRGHSDRLFKRDWAGEMMETYPDLKLVDYGFIYHLDPVFPGDDLNWFLMEKRTLAQHTSTVD